MGVTPSVQQLLQDGGSDYRAALFGAYEAIAAHAAVDSAADSEVSVLPFPSGAGGRLVVAPTGALDRDYDDCRRFFDAAEKGVERAIKAGAKNPLLFVFASPVAAARFPLATDAAVLGAHTAMCEQCGARAIVVTSLDYALQGTSLSKHASSTPNSKRPPSSSSSGSPATECKSYSPSPTGSVWRVTLGAATPSARPPSKLRSECVIVCVQLAAAEATA